MPTKQAQRSTAWFWICLFIAIYVVVSGGLAIATSDTCDGGGSTDGSKTWQPLPPHWECG